jgi:osmotically inducible lipoprotein OsmB
MLASSRVTKIAAISLLALTAAGCSNMNNKEQRALSGGAIGAAAGTALGIVTGHTLAGALIGAGAGAATGALTAD